MLFREVVALRSKNRSKQPATLCGHVMLKQTVYVATSALWGVAFVSWFRFNWHILHGSRNGGSKYGDTGCGRDDLFCILNQLLELPMRTLLHAELVDLLTKTCRKRFCACASAYRYKMTDLFFFKHSKNTFYSVECFEFVINISIHVS